MLITSAICHLQTGDHGKLVVQFSVSLKSKNREQVVKNWSDPGRLRIGAPVSMSRRWSHSESKSASHKPLLFRGSQ